MPQLHRRRDGSVTIDLDQVKTIGIKNITELRNYARSELNGQILHLFEFEGGGACEITYLKNGNIEFFSGRGIDIQADDGGNVMIVRAG
jgi:hypothetical protein